MRFSNCLPLVIMVAALFCGLAAAQKSADRSTAGTRILAMAGPGGSVAIGNNLASAKRAFPVDKGAQETNTGMNFAILQRPGWGWSTEKTNRAFEVSLRDGKIVGIAHTIEVPDKVKRTNMMTGILQKHPVPAGKSIGKSASAYSWVSGKNARFLIVMDAGMFGSGPILLELIGAKEDLKLLNYHADDVATLVKQIDMGTEAMKEYQRKPKKGEPRP